MADVAPVLTEAMAAEVNALIEANVGTTLVADVNNYFTVFSGYLVFFMQAGFAMLCAGSVRSKNAKNIILLNILDACFGCCAWYLTGFAFAFGDPVPFEHCGGLEGPALLECEAGDPIPGLSASQAFIGNRFFAQSNLPRSSFWLWFFQFTFAATGATIVSGAVAERCKFEAYMLYELMIVMFVYPVVAHWMWSTCGWLSPWRSEATAAKQSYLYFAGSGVYDFAGDAAVHMVGGVASLAAAWVLGPRIGRFDAAGNPVSLCAMRPATHCAQNVCCGLPLLACLLVWA